MLLAETGPDQARETLERVQLALATRPIDLGGQRVSFTLSAGIAGWPGEPESLEALLGRADQALYQAKAVGRGRIRLAD